MEREARYTAGGNERRTQGGDVGWDQQRLTGDLLLGAVLVSDPQSPSGAGRGRSGLCEGPGQGMWRLSHWKYLLVESTHNAKKALTVREWAWPGGWFTAAWQVCMPVVVLAFYSPSGKEPLSGRREVGK